MYILLYFVNVKKCRFWICFCTRHSLFKFIELQNVLLFCKSIDFLKYGLSISPKFASLDKNGSGNYIVIPYPKNRNIFLKCTLMIILIKENYNPYKYNNCIWYRIEMVLWHFHFLLRDWTIFYIYINTWKFKSAMNTHTKEVTLQNFSYRLSCIS